MANYAAFYYPLPDMYKQTLTTSLDTELIRSDFDTPHVPLDLLEFYPQYFNDGDITRAAVTPRINVDYAAFVIDTWVNDLFGHILAVPARLDMGNLLSNQIRTIELANLFLTDVDLEDIINNAGAGINFPAPSFPVTIPSFGSFLLEVSVSAAGPPTLSGSIDFEFDVSDITVPVTGQRIIMFEWQPDVPVQEILEWSTDVLESYDGSEQRISIRLTCRQVISMTVVFDDEFQAARMRNTTFDWLARIWGVPIWWEQRTLTAAAQPGDTILEFDTRYGDFRVGGLICIVAPDGSFESFEIESFTDSQMQLTSGVVNDYDILTQVMPVRTAYANTSPSQQRDNVAVEQINIMFTTLDNIDLADATGQAVFDGKLLLNDANVSNGKLPESMDRPVIIIDNEAGKIYQRSRTDRSRLRTRKQWVTHGLAELWRVRRLLHVLRGSQKSFFIPTFRPDFIVTQTIGGGSASFVIRNCGYTQFAKARRPLSDVRFLLKDGREMVRHITGSSIDEDEEIVTISSPIDDDPILPSAIYRVELVHLSRIVDDKATFMHSAAGESVITVNVISCKE